MNTVLGTEEAAAIARRLAGASSVGIVVDLEPYRERRRTRAYAAGFLAGLAIAIWVLPAIAELAELFLDITTDPPTNPDAARVDLDALRAYTEDT